VNFFISPVNTLRRNTSIHIANKTYMNFMGLLEK